MPSSYVTIRLVLVDIVAWTTKSGRYTWAALRRLQQPWSRRSCRPGYLPRLANDLRYSRNDVKAEKNDYWQSELATIRPLRQTKTERGANEKERSSAFLSYLFYCRGLLALLGTSGCPGATAGFVFGAMSPQRDLLPFPFADAAYSHLRGAGGSRDLRLASEGASRDALDKSVHSEACYVLGARRDLESASNDAPKIAAHITKNNLRRTSEGASRDVPPTLRQIVLGRK